MSRFDPQKWSARISRFFLSGKGVLGYIQATIKSLFKKLMYWSSVCVIGIVLAGIILHFSGVPLFDTTLVQAADVADQSDTSIGRGVVLLLLNLIYYLMIVPIGIINGVLAYILQIVITYPFGAVWGLVGNDDPTKGGFVNVSAVITGWKLMRDICNIFFSLILVIIALATVLKIEAFSWKQLLPKFILMAILINFSKTICGVFTDFATVAMATFGGSFGSSYGTGLVSAFGLPSLGNLIASVGGGQGATLGQGDPLPGLMLSYLVAGFMQVAFFVIMLVFTVMLVFRIVILWFLIVLSPAAYITRILPETQKYSSQWWEMFGRYVVIGPLITFFLWLTLSMTLGSSANTGLNGNPIGQVFTETTSQATTQVAGFERLQTVGSFQSATPNALANFLIATMLMLASLKFITGMASEIGSIVSTAENAAYGLGWRMMDKAGQWTGNRGMRWASKYGAKVDKDGNRIPQDAFRSIMARLGNAQTYLGATLFQPKQFINSALEAAKETSNWTQSIFRSNVMNEADALRERDIMGKGVWRGLNGLTSNAMGISMGLGMDNARGVWREYATGSGLTRAIGKAQAYAAEISPAFMHLKEDGFFGGPWGLATRFKNQEKDKKALEDQKKVLNEERATKEEANEMNLGFQDGVKKRDTLQKLVEDLGTVGTPGASMVQLNLNIPEITAVIDAQRESIQDEIKRAERLGPEGQDKAAQLRLQLKELEAGVTAGTVTDAEAFFDKISGVYVDNNADPSVQQDQQADKQRRKQELLTSVTTAATGLNEDLGKDLDKLRERMEKAGFTFDANGVASLPIQFTTTGERDKIDQLVKDATTEFDRLKSELGVYLPGQNPESRAVWQRGDKDAEKQLDGIETPAELTAYYKRGLLFQDSNLQTVALKKIVKNFGMPFFMKAYGGTNLEGVKNLKEELVNKGGMSEQQALAILNDVLGAAGDKGVNGLYASVKYDGGKWHMQDAKTQLSIQNIIMGKQTPDAIVKWDKYGYGSEDVNGDFTVSPFAIKQLLLQGDSLAGKRFWDRMPVEVRKTLSDPKVITQLKQNNVSSQFVNNLEAFRRRVGDIMNQDPPRRNRLSRYA